MMGMLGILIVVSQYLRVHTSPPKSKFRLALALMPGEGMDPRFWKGQGRNHL
jgi:hypothetical protein